MQTFEVRSPAVRRGEKLPPKYSAEEQGRNLSMPLHIDALPHGTQSVVFALVDRDASDYVHWMVVDVAPGDIRIPEGASRAQMPTGARELYNSAGYQGYAGPKPPPRTTHRYELLAMALDVPTLEVDERMDWQAFRGVAEKHAIATGEDYWLYTHQ